MSPVPAIVLLMIVYMASMIGFTTPHQQAWYLYYTPYFLLLNAIILAVYQKNKDKSLVLFWGSTLVAGTMIEGVAAKTGALYGAYRFGESLGPLVAEIPAAMPIYWLVIVGSSAVVAAKLLPKQTVGRILLGTLLAVGLNVLVQQVAARLDFWYLETSQLWQYILVQGLVVALLNYLFGRWQVSSDNKLAGYIYGGLLIFFGGVAFFLKG